MLGRVSRPGHVPSRLRYRPFRGRDAVAAGLLTRRQLTSAHWKRLFPDVYLHHDAELDHLTWCKAAALMLPEGGVISGTSAAFLYGADVLPLDPPVEVSLPVARRMSPHPKLVITRTRFDRGDTRKFGSIPVTTLARTAFDLARRERTNAVVGLDALLRRGATDIEEVRAYLAARPGWPGVRRAAVALALANPLAESPMETRLRLILVEAGLPTPVAQYQVGRYRLDLAYPKLKVAIEYDGDHHRDRATFRRDVARLNALRAAGWTVLRFTADDVLRNPARIIAQVTTVLG
jgi:very-short-patch-repair endonuclease